MERTVVAFFVCYYLLLCVPWIPHLPHYPVTDLLLPPLIVVEWYYSNPLLLLTLRLLLLFGLVVLCVLYLFPIPVHLPPDYLLVLIIVCLYLTPLIARTNSSPP